MQIIIVQHEIEQAIRDHIASRLTVAAGVKMEIDLQATRGPEGYRAIINITEQAQDTAPVPPSLPEAQPAGAQVTPLRPSAPPPGQAEESASRPSIFGGTRTPRTPAEVRAMMDAEAKAEEEAAKTEKAETAGAESQGEAPAEAAPAATDAPPFETSSDADKKEDTSSGPAPAAAAGASRSLFKGLKNPRNS